MTITLQGLMRADTAALSSAADRWDRVGAALDAAVEDQGRATRDLPNHWSSGPGAQAAQEANADLRARIGNAYVHCHQIALAVRGFAEDMVHFRQKLRGLVGDAERDGLRIDLASGQITGPFEAGTALIDSYVQQISEILTQANALDQEGAGLVNAHILYEGAAPTGDLRPLNEISLASLSTSEPYYRAMWWDAQHPLNQDRAIAEHPEIVGASVGFPSGARDAANRLLLERQHAALLTQRTQLLGSAAGQSPDQAHRDQLQQVDARIGAIDHLQRRLDDPARPKAYLTGYRPGQETAAVLSHGDTEWDRTDVALMGRWPK
jgi:hypothetical protein